MTFKLIEITNAQQKGRICGQILRSLAGWFDVEASIVEYERTTQCMPFYAAFDDDKVIGFVAIKVHNRYTAEVCVMGVLTDYHRAGLGRALIERCVCFCKENEMEFLTVKTLDESRASSHYEKTRLFYQSMGFRPLEVFGTIWDEDNPCLFMCKPIDR